MKFEEMPLHDAVLDTIEYQWQSKSVTLRGHLCSNEPKEFELIFSGVSLLEVPRNEEWGPSSSINGLKSDGSVYIINMQTGDNIVVEALNYSYAAKNT